MATCAIRAPVEGYVPGRRQADDRIVIVAAVTARRANIGMVKGGSVPICSVVAIFTRIV